MSNPEAAKQIQRCRDIALAGAWRHPFFLIPLAQFDWVPLEGAKPEDAEMLVTTSRKLVVNVDKIAKLNDGEVFGSIARVIMRIMLNHASRRESRDKKDWESACEMIINQSLQESNIKLPPNPLVPPVEVRGKDVTADEIYDIVHKMVEQKKPNPPGSQFGPGRVVDDKDNGQVDAGDQEGDGEGQGNQPQPGQGQSDERFWQEIMAQASSMGRGQGSFQSLAKILKPRERKQRWDRLIKGFANQAVARGGRDMQTFSRVNRRSGDVILPGWKSQRPSIAVIIDSSGSVSDQMLAAALTEVKALAELAAVRIYMAIHDGVCYWHGWVKAETTVQEMSKLASRRGGTDPRQAFERIGEAKGRFDALVYLTDGEVGQYPDKPMNVKRVCVALSRMSQYKTPTPDGWQEVPIEVDTSVLEP